MEKMLIRLSMVVASGALTACAMPVPTLKGESIQPPKVEPTIVEIPVPPLKAESILYNAINEHIPPSDTKKIDLISTVDTLDYRAEKPVISTSPNSISSRINIQYHHLRDKRHCGWRGIKKGFQCDLNNILDTNGSMILGLDSKFAFTPNWDLAFTSAPYFDGPSNLSALTTFALTKLATKFDAKASQAGEFRNKVQTAWQTLNTPIKIDDAVWLKVEPTQIWTTPITVRDNSLAFSLGLRATPRVVYENPLTTEPVMPTWSERPALGGKFDISLETKLAFSEAQQALKKAMQGLKLTSRMGSVEVEDVSFSALNSSVLIGLKVNSLLYHGWVFLTGEIEYNQINEGFLVRNLRLNVPTLNPAVRFVASFFKGEFESQVESLAHWQTQGASEALIAQAEKRFSEASKGTLGLNIFRIEPVVDEKTGHQVLFTSKGAIHLAIIASGKIYYRASLAELTKSS